MRSLPIPLPVLTFLTLVATSLAVAGGAGCARWLREEPQPVARVEIPTPDVAEDVDVIQITGQRALASGFESSSITSFNQESLDRLGVSEGGLFGQSAWVDGAMNTEHYDAVSETGFRSPQREPLSTFAADEEMINYFRYDDPPPGEGRPFSLTAEVAEAPWQPDHWLLRIGLRSRSVDERGVPPRNLVFLLDVSGSMQPADKLPLVKRAMSLLVERLRPEDRVAIVVYAGASGLALPSTPGSDRSAIRSALAALEAGGSTNGGEGIELAYRIAREQFAAGGVNRVILATDGDFNVGATSRSELTRLIERESGVFLTVLGVGTGNLQDAQMEQLADRGNGNYAYLDSLSEARKVLVREAGATLVTLAKDVKLQVEFNPARVGAYRLIGYENRRLNAEDFNDDRKDAGEIGAGHRVTALYELVPPGPAAAAFVGDVDPLRYQSSLDVELAAVDARELALVKVRYKRPDGDDSELLEREVEAAIDRIEHASPDLRFGASVAWFGMWLQNSEFVGASDLAGVAALAGGALGDDPAAERTEFLTLVARAEALGTDRHAAVDSSAGP